MRLTNLPAAPFDKTGWPWTQESPALAPTPPNGSDWPRISVVTASYNQSPFVEEAMRSVLLQGYPNLEYVVMDGGSTDGSIEIIRKYEAWLTDWRTGPDGGQSKAIDTGFQRTNGEILVWLNSDDVFEPGALHWAANHFHRHPDAALVYGDAYEIARDGTRLGRSQQVRACDRQFLIQEDNAVVQPAAFFKRSAYQAVGGLDHGLNWAIDYDLWIRLAGLGPLIRVPEVLAQTRIYPEAKSASGSRAMFDEIRQVVERYGGHGLPRHFARWLGEIMVPQALAAYRRDDLETGRELLNYAIANAPEWRSEIRLAETLAGDAWRRISDMGEEPAVTLRWVTQICRGLPSIFIAPSRVEQRVLGLLYEALAFQCYRQRRIAEGFGYAARAIAHDRHRAANRGLWSVAIRSLLKV